MKGKIKAIYSDGISTVYNYICRGEDGLFNFPVKHRYHYDILESENGSIGSEIEYDSETKGLSFLN